MSRETKEYYSFVPMDKTKILECIEEKYSEYKVTTKEETVERYYKFKDKCFIKVYKDRYNKNGKKERNGKILMYGRNEDYQEFREKDMRLNCNAVEESKSDSPLISDLNFNHKIIGSDETGKGETFKYLIVTAAYIEGVNDIKRFIELGIDDSKDIPSKIQAIGEEITCIHSWDELLEKLNEKNLFVTDCSVTKIITNEEYNERCCEKKENVNDIIKEAHVEVLKEIYKRYPDSKIVVDDFYGKKKNAIDDFKKELSFGNSSIKCENVFMTVKADSKIMAVSLASVISTYICNLGCDYVQKMVNNIYKKDSKAKLNLPKGNPGTTELSEFFSKLKPEQKDEFINRYVKKSFDNVQSVIKETI